VDYAAEISNCNFFTSVSVLIAKGFLYKNDMTTIEYNRCVDNHADALYRFVLKNIKDDDSAQDVVQEAFVRMWEKREEINGEKSKSYLFTTAYHLLVDNVRHQERFTELNYSSHDSYEETGHYSDLQDILNQAVEQLPLDQKTVLLLRDYEGYSYDEIGKITGLNESQVKVYIYRARLFLKKYIGRMEAVI
jgi:RNA polymerase sigma-70 factor (ECF subfamily)